MYHSPLICNGARSWNTERPARHVFVSTQQLLEGSIYVLVVARTDLYQLLCTVHLCYTNIESAAGGSVIRSER